MSNQYSADEIRAAYDLMMTAGRMAALVDYSLAQAVLESMEIVDSIMPMTDPTTWIRLQKTAPAHKAFARAFVRFRAALEEFKPDLE